MGNEQKSFVNEIVPYFSPDENESVLDSLFRSYEKVIFKSIVTAFGLDFFIKDRYGGDVDTLYNVRKVGIDPKMQYKSPANEDAYNNRGDYSHKDVEGSGTNYQRIKHEARKNYGEDPENNTVEDSYTGKQLGFLGKSKGHPTEESAELDHVISAKHIHDDRARTLAGVSTKELADDEENLCFTNEHLNKSMRDDEIPDYIAKHPELPEETKKRMMEAYNRARANYEKKLAKAYYFDFSNPNCRQFYRETALSAGRRGAEMGISQAIGFLITELWFDIKDEIRNSDGTVEGVFKAICTGFENWILNGKENYEALFIQFKDGLLSGIMSSLTSTFLNTFVTTSENIGRILRHSWASVVEATKILFFDSSEKYYCDRMVSAAKVIATGASAVAGTLVQQELSQKLAPLSIPQKLKDTISTFANGLCSGLLSVTLIFYIDNDPFGKFLDKYYGQNVENMRLQGEKFKAYCAELHKVDIQSLDCEIRLVYKLSESLCNTDSIDETNRLLKNASQKIGIKAPWEGSTLDAKMNDPNWVLMI